MTRWIWRFRSPPHDGNIKRIWSFSTIFGAIAVTVFVTTEIVSVAWATLWSLIGYFQLGTGSIIFLSAVIGIPAIYVSWLVANLAIEAETDPENN